MFCTSCSRLPFGRLSLNSPAFCARKAYSSGSSMVPGSSMSAARAKPVTTPVSQMFPSTFPFAPPEW